VGVDSPDTDQVCEAVNSVRSLEVDKNRIPTWRNHVQRLIELYHDAA